jgi:hypothetical protein
MGINNQAVDSIGINISSSEISEKWQNSGFFALYGFILIALFSLIFFVSSLSPDMRKAIIQEDGPVESLSAAGYFICAILLLVIPKKKVSDCWQLIVVLLAFGFRELDFNSRFTQISMTKLKFYVSQQIPLIQKICAVFCALLIFYCLIHLLRCHFRSFIISLKKNEPYAICIFTGFIFLFAALVLDGLEGKMRHINIIIGMDLTPWATSTEEILELGIPVMFIFGLIKATMEENIARFKFIYRRHMPESQPLYRHET